MSSAKWSGIEQKKYGLTARWYVSAKYGYATDEGGWGLYNPVSNVDGWGGKKRPFATISKLLQEKGPSDITVLDSGYYSYASPVNVPINCVGDGVVLFSVSFSTVNAQVHFHNIIVISANIGGITTYLHNISDCIFVYSSLRCRDGNQKMKNCLFIETGFTNGGSELSNCTVIKGTGSYFPLAKSSIGNIIIDSPNLTILLTASRPSGVINDYSIIIGTVKTSVAINGKTTGVTVEDFKADGQYFRKSYSEVDLFGNAPGSGASVAQLNTIFNNFYYPYIDDWQYLDLSLKPDVDDRVRYGGLNGHFIGALPVGYHFDIPTLWNTYKDAGNTTNVELNMMDRLIRTNPTIPGVYTSTTITLPSVIDETDVAMFFKNNVYDSNGVAMQRLDYSVDLDKDAALEQRTVYSYRMKTSPDDVTPLTAWKEYELDRAPTVDASGNSNIDDLFDSATETKQPIKRFIIEITLRSE